MMLVPVTFPTTDAFVIEAIEDALTPTYASGLHVDAVEPATKTRRMVTVRDDSGPQEQVVANRRYGVNVKADSRVDAKQMCADAMSHLRGVADGNPVVSVGGFTGPFEIPDDPAQAVTKNLWHFYFTFGLVVRGTNP